MRGLADVRHLGPFDLVVAGGLFDYLPDGIALRVLRQARTRLVAPGGKLVFTNIAQANPFRRWMGCVVDWTLIHRTEVDLRTLCRDAGFPDGHVAMSRNDTQLALIVECRGE